METATVMIRPWCDQDSQIDLPVDDPIAVIRHDVGRGRFHRITSPFAYVLNHVDLVSAGLWGQLGQTGQLLLGNRVAMGKTTRRAGGKNRCQRQEPQALRATQAKKEKSLLRTAHQSI